MSRASKANETENPTEKFLAKKATINSLFSQEVFERLESQSKPIYCLAKMKTEEEFNRAKIVAFSDGRLQVFYLDYGDYGWLKKEDIFPIPSKFLRLLPFQAIEVALAALADEKEWPSKAGDDLWSLTHDEENCFCLLLAKVVSFKEADGFKTYSIDLFKPNYPELVNIAYRLVAMNSGRLNECEEAVLFERNESENASNNSTACQQVKALSKQIVNTFVR